MIRYLEKADDFNDIIKDDKILVDFYADWCGHCKVLGDLLENIDYINILKINVDIFSNIAKEFGIMSIPTLCFFKNGHLVEKKIGLQSLEEIKNITDKI